MIDLNKPRLTAKGNKYELLFGHKPLYARLYARLQELENAIEDGELAPVVRGEWILQGENEHDYETSLEEKCSLCGRYVYRYDTQPQDNYCPNCGAKMVGG